MGTKAGKHTHALLLLLPAFLSPAASPGGVCAAESSWIQAFACLARRCACRPGLAPAGMHVKLGGCCRSAALGRSIRGEDVELGPLIGQGSFGKVYRGVWNGAPVACESETAEPAMRAS